MKAGSRLEHVLRSGRFAVTAELNPPDSADPEEVSNGALVLSIGPSAMPSMRLMPPATMSTCPVWQCVRF